MRKHIDINHIIAIARNAGDAIMEIYSQDFSVTHKDDKSPLTAADTKSNEIIVDGLHGLSVVFPILSEEGNTISYDVRKDWDYFWMVDPLDGTKEFINKNGEFTVNIALIHKGEPILGVVYAPAFNEMYYAKKGEGAFKNGIGLPIGKNDKSNKVLRVVASKSHLNKETEAYINALKKSAGTIQCVSRGSSLKLCMVAEGTADIYPRLAPTMEWDTAAADAIVREAGKKTYQYNSNTFIAYNKENLLNPWFIVC